MKSAVMVGLGVGVKLSNPSSHLRSAERTFFQFPFHPPTQKITVFAVDAVVHSHELWRRTRNA